MGPVPWNWENSTVLIQFGESLKEHEADKLRKFTLNQHFIQTLLNYPLPLILSFRICALHIQYLYLKFFTFAVCSKLGIFFPFLGKKDTIWHWDWVHITDPNSLEKKSWVGQKLRNIKMVKVTNVTELYPW